MKSINISLNKFLKEKAESTIIDKRDAILLLLYTIRMLKTENRIKPGGKVDCVILISKMSRIIYSVRDKIFSIHFPFNIELFGDVINEVYYCVNNVIIDDVLLSFLISFFENKDISIYSFDSLFDAIIDYDECNSTRLLNLRDVEYYYNDLWVIISNLLMFDLGYIRFDIDFKNENGNRHPIFHFDIFLDEKVKFKIGLYKRIDIDTLINVLDVKSDCYYLKI